MSNKGFMKSFTRTAPKNGQDFYPTPAWATKALMERFEGMFLEDFWEPSCGQGHIAKVLTKYGNVMCTDLYDYGYGTSGVDFLNAEVPKNVKTIITNPPYNLANEFVIKAIEHIKSGKIEHAAFLLRLQFLESNKRYKEIFEQRCLQKIYVFSERLTFKQLSNAVCYAWFIWSRNSYFVGGSPYIEWFPPGTRDKFIDKTKEN